MLVPAAAAPVEAPASLGVALGRLQLANPILVASGTFGYAREMAGLVDLARLGGILPKTITQQPRPGNAPWRTVETPAGCSTRSASTTTASRPSSRITCPTWPAADVPIIVSIAGRTHDEFVADGRAARSPLPASPRSN